MKKLLSILVIGLLVAAPVYAQLDFGIKAGLNLAGEPTNINKENVGSKDSYTGFFVGGMVKATLPIVGLGVEGDILYSRTGVEIDGEKAKRNTIEIPVYLRYDLSLPIVSKIVVPFVAVGPQFGFDVSSDDIYKALEGKYNSYSFKKSTLSLNLGVGAILLKHIQAHINYNIPLGDTGEFETGTVVDTSTKVISDVYGSKSKTWQFSVAYLF